MTSIVSKAKSKPQPAARDASSGQFSVPVWRVRTQSDVDGIMPQVQKAVREAQHALGLLTFTLAIETGKGQRHEPEPVGFEVAAERALLGILLFDNATFAQAKGLDASVFRDDLDARIFLEMKADIAQGKLAEPIHLDQRLRADAAYRAAGGIRYLAELVDQAPPSRDVGALVRLLRDLTAAKNSDRGNASEGSLDDLDAALAEAEARGASRATEVLTGPEMLGADDFAALLGMTREAVRQKLKRREVLGLQGAKRGVRYPSWQVTRDGGLLPALPHLFVILGESPWTLYRFLTQPNPAFSGKPPLESLRSGHVAEVIAAATAHARGDYS